ncbi:hypothetical protein R3P38DRAFT_2784828 [Favolaschia claudopus]|uniref:Uncharacterized protein n=1 Tax=Favolaschia claudopus TaxID=2862362 RepID=A0AAW0AWH5_9AGAR
MTVQKNIAGTKYVPNGLQTMVSLTCYMASNGNRRPKAETLIAQSINQALETSGILTRFRDIKLKWFGKEIEEHTIQQGSVRVNNGMQQDIGELAAHSCPLERKGNQGHQSEGKRCIQVATSHYKARLHRDSQYKASRVITLGMLATVTGNWAPNSFKRVPERGEFGATTTAWEGIGGNSEKCLPNPGNSEQQLE